MDKCGKTRKILLTEDVDIYEGILGPYMNSLRGKITNTKPNKFHRDDIKTPR